MLWSCPTVQVGFLRADLTGHIPLESCSKTGHLRRCSPSLQGVTELRWGLEALSRGVNRNSSARSKAGFLPGGEPQGFGNHIFSNRPLLMSAVGRGRGMRVLLAGGIAFP
jgi:hypothetical protein